MFKPGTIDAVFASVERMAGRGNVPCLVDFKVELSGNAILGLSVAIISRRHSASVSFIKCDVAPLSLLAMTTFCLGRLVILLIQGDVVVDKHIFGLLSLIVSLLSPQHLQQKRVAMPLWLPP